MTSHPAIRFLDRTTPPHITTLILMAGLAALSLNVFLPSLPSMALHFGVPYPAMQLSVSLYLATTAVLQLFIGPISDRFGRRRIMLATTAIFLIASLGALYAPNFTVFMAFRLLQAAIATAFMVSRAVVRDMVGQDQAASMIGYVTMGMSIVPMIGPVIGGQLDEWFGWRASFWVMAAGGAGLLALIWADQGETAVKAPTSLAAQVSQYPQLLTSQRFWGYCLAAALASGAFFAYLGGAPFVGTDVYGLTPSALGFYFGAPALGYLAGNFLSGRYSVTAGINRMMVYGALISLFGMALLALLTALGFSSPQLFFGLTIFVGVGNGVLLPSANAGLLSVRPALAGSAAGLGGAFTIGGGAALAAMAGLILTHGSGPMPLVLLMLVTAVLTLMCVYWVIRRARAVGAA